MNSKVMECTNQTVAEWVNNPKDCRNVEQFTKDQIRAAIREFAEMMKDRAIKVTFGNGAVEYTVTQGMIRELRTAFGVDDK